MKASEDMLPSTKSLSISPVREVLVKNFSVLLLALSTVVLATLRSDTPPDYALLVAWFGGGVMVGIVIGRMSEIHFAEELRKRRERWAKEDAELVARAAKIGLELPKRKP